MLEILPIMLALCLLFFMPIMLNYTGIIGTSLHIQRSKMVCHRTCSDPFQYSYVYMYMTKQSQNVLYSVATLESLKICNNVTTSDI